jgi:hypothetical protein
VAVSPPCNLGKCGPWATGGALMMCGSRGVTVPSDGGRAAFAVSAFDRRWREHLLAAHAAQARVAAVTRNCCNGCNGFCVEVSGPCVRELGACVTSGHLIVDALRRKAPNTPPFRSDFRWPACLVAAITQMRLMSRLAFLLTGAVVM